MTPKEKAKELVDKFKKVELYHSMEPTDFDCEIKDISSASFTAKQCALICVDEIIRSNPINWYNNGFEWEKELFTTPVNEGWVDGEKYWKVVKNEIENL